MKTSAQKLESEVQKIYSHRHSSEEKNHLERVWKILTSKFFQRWVDPGDSVLDLGAGHCFFINHIQAKNKYAVDANPDSGKNCRGSVQFIQSHDLNQVELSTPVDVIFMSNFLEHLDQPSQVLEVLNAAHQKLRPNGRLLILQPNFALLGAQYFDFIDHKTILTDKSLVEALEISNFEMSYIKRRFLPYTYKSRLPKFLWLVRLYLYLPFAQLIFGKQTFVVATARKN